MVRTTLEQVNSPYRKDRWRWCLGRSMSTTLQHSRRGSLTLGIALVESGLQRHLHTANRIASVPPKWLTTTSIHQSMKCSVGTRSSSPKKPITTKPHRFTDRGSPKRQTSSVRASFRTDNGMRSVLTRKRPTHGAPPRRHERMTAVPQGHRGSSAPDPETIECRCWCCYIVAQCVS
jgi:hypothetical protein